LAERALPSTLAGVAALGLAALATLLAGCASGPRSDGAPSVPPANLSQTPDAEPRIETIRSSGGTSKAYSVRGQRYVPMTDDRPFQERGLASWYGTGFHAQQTANGEAYDMYAMTAAHKTLPLPSYARVRNPANGREAIVRINDRGPFVDGRVIDLSYAAAARLGYLGGVAPVEIERITNEDIRTGAWRRDAAVQLASAGSAPAAVPLARGGASASPAGRAVAVPAAWTVPAAAGGADLAVSQATPQPVAANTAAPADPASSAPAEPPSSRNIEATALPPLAPIAPLAPLPSAAGSGSRPETAPAAAPATVGGFWIQLGAFRARDGAVAMQERIERDTARPVGALQVYEDGGLYRLQSGPHASRADAVQAQARWRLQLGGSPIVVQRP